MPIAPTQTKRLLLREFGPNDAHALVAVEGSAKMVEYQSHDPFSPDSAEKYVRQAVGAQTSPVRDYVELAVCLLNGEFIGRVGASLEEDAAWIWYVIAHPQQGQGYGSEAVETLLVVLADLGIATVQLECDPRNLASCRLAERLGFARFQTEDTTLVVKGVECPSRIYKKTLAF